MAARVAALSALFSCQARKPSFSTAFQTRWRYVRMSAAHCGASASTFRKVESAPAASPISV